MKLSDLLKIEEFEGCYEIQYKKKVYDSKDFFKLAVNGEIDNVDYEYQCNITFAECYTLYPSSDKDKWNSKEVILIFPPMYANND